MEISNQKLYVSFHWSASIKAVDYFPVILQVFLEKMCMIIQQKIEIIKKIIKMDDCNYHYFLILS